jgi:hypothetical protein
MKNLSFILWVLVAVMSFAIFANGQSRRDYMTEAEIEIVRDAQDIDTRIEVLTKMIDRRFAILNTNVGVATVPDKETDKWGAAPKGTRTQILDDIRNLLQKAIDDIDNVASHPVDYSVDKDRSEKQKKKDTQRFPNSVRELAASARRYQPALRSLLEKSTDERDKGLILAALESCDEVIAASGKLPAQEKAN